MTKNWAGVRLKIREHVVGDSYIISSVSFFCPVVVVVVVVVVVAGCHPKSL